MSFNGVRAYARTPMMPPRISAAGLPVQQVPLRSTSGASTSVPANGVASGSRPSRTLVRGVTPRDLPAKPPDALESPPSSSRRARELVGHEVVESEYDGSAICSDSDDPSSGPYWLVNVNHDNFNMLVGLIITANAMVIGLETDLGDEDFIFFEHFFCIFFILEMVMRLFQNGCLAYITDPSSLFDGSLVVSGTADLYIMPYLVSSKKGGFASTLRLLRMLRVMRILRLFKVFKELMVILNAFLNAFSAVMWVSILTLILDYVCAVFLTQTVGHHAHIWGPNEEKVLVWFGSIGHSMRTLFIVMTLAEWDEIALTLQEQINGLIVFFFAGLYVMIAAITMVSLIIGIISEAIVAAQEEARKDAEEQMEEEKDKALADLRDQFNQLDSNKDGFLAYKKAEKHLTNNPRLLTKLASMDLDFSQVQLLDLVRKVSAQNADADTQQKADQNGDAEAEPPPCNIKELVEALDQQKGMASAMSIYDLKHRISALKKKDKVLREKSKKLEESFAALMRSKGIQ